MAQVVGRVADRECEHCGNAAGPWVGCHTVVGLLNGSCANCHYNNMGTRYTLRTFTGHPRTLLRLVVNGLGLKLSVAELGKLIDAAKQAEAAKGNLPPGGNLPPVPPPGGILPPGGNKPQGPRRLPGNMIVTGALGSDPATWQIPAGV